MAKQIQVNQILKAREKTHGNFLMKANFIHEIMDNISELYTYRDMEVDQKEALHMIIHKMSRILYGNPDHIDNWVDIAGYATLIANRLQLEEKVNESVK
jgi:muconolactone delta-isomerase